MEVVHLPAPVCLLSGEDMLSVSHTILAQYLTQSPPHPPPQGV